MAALFTISTDRLHLVWDGPAGPPDVSAPAGHLRVQPLRSGLRPRVEVGGEVRTGEAPLRLVEQAPYRVFVRSLSGAPVVLRQDDPLALRALIANESGTILSGTVDFGGQIGRSRFVALVDGREEVAFEVEVFPVKASFAEVEAMREALDEAFAGLAFEYLRSTASQAEHAFATSKRASWLVMLRSMLPELETSLCRIAAHPRYDLQRESIPVRVDRLQRPDATLRRAVLRGRGGGPLIPLNSGMAVRAVLPERLAVPTLDTPEHRWLRSRIDAAKVALSIVQHDESRLPGTARRRQVRRDITEAESRLARMLRLAPLAAAAAAAPPAMPTQRLLRAPGYGEAYRALQQLSLSLALADGPVPHATRDLHLLYEMWCYLTVLQRTAHLLGSSLPATGFFQAEHHGIRLMLRRGRCYRVVFEEGARRVEVTYNPRFPARRGLLVQRPDILIAVEGSTVEHFVLDAKYRRDDSAGYRRRFGAPGPPEHALGDLHRYRDAIRAPDGRRIVGQAVALFPARADEAFGESRLWSAIEHVGVGAIPLVPGATDWLDRWLTDVLG